MLAWRSLVSLNELGSYHCLQIGWKSLHHWQFPPSMRSHDWSSLLAVFDCQHFYVWFLSASSLLCTFYTLIRSHWPLCSFLHRFQWLGNFGPGSRALSKDSCSLEQVQQNVVSCWTLTLLCAFLQLPYQDETNRSDNWSCVFYDLSHVDCL